MRTLRWYRRRQMRALVVLALLATVAHADPDKDAVTGDADTVDGTETTGMVAFTFDDGPRVGTTEKVLDALVQYDIPATFFVVGNRLVGKSKHAQASRDLVTKELSLGFMVGNHSWNHPNLRTLDDKHVAWQIDATSKAIRAITSAPIGLFRPPYGALGKKQAKLVAARHLTPVFWDIDSSDWKRPKVAKLRKAMLAAIFKKDGGVVLFHDTKKLTARVIASIFDDLEAENCAHLDAGESIVVPVSLHYFLQDSGTARAIPADVEARTQRYRDNLPTRCAARKEGHK